MSRLKSLLSQPQAAHGALVTVALAATAIVGSAADFTASSTNPADTFAAGTLHIGGLRGARITVTIQVRTAAKHTYRASRVYKSRAKAR
jgi:hypothetical protein